MLPTNLRYGSKVESAPARSVRSNIQPQNGTSGYNLGDTITINVPTRSNLVMSPMDNYLKFDLAVNNTSGAPASYRWDSAGAHGLIQLIRVYSGSNLIEHIDNYNMLAKMLFDLQVSTDAAYGKFNILAGCRNDLVVKPLTNITSSPDATIAYTAINNGALSAYQCNSGESLNGGNTTIAAGGSTVTNTYCLNLISIMGALCQKQYFPLFACTSSAIRIEIQLVDSLPKAMLSTSAVGTITLSNVEFVANNIELSDVAMGMISQSLQGQPLQFVAPQWKNIPASQWPLNIGSTTEISFPIAAKYSSLKAIFVSCRDQGTGAAGYFPFSSVTRNIQSYYFRIGPTIMPPKQPSRIPEMFAECVKAIGSLGDLNHQPSIEKISYSQQVSPQAGAIGTTVTNGGDPLYSNIQSGSFYVGLDLENYSSAEKSSYFAGYNSCTDDIYYVATFGNQGTAVTPRFDSFSMFDCVYVFENNVCYIRF